MSIIDAYRSGQALTTGLGVSTVTPSGDFETYSEAGYELNHVTGARRGLGTQGKGGLPAVGTPVYVEHPSAAVLCFYYDLKEGRGRRPWFPGAPNPQDLFDHIAAGGLFEAWNVTFEWYVWNMICVRKYGWPPLPLEQCRCVMARSRRNGLPGGLDSAAKVLGTTRKDPRGTALIRLLTVPQKWTKAHREFRWTPATAWDKFLEMYAYCDQDVMSEDQAAARIPDLSAYELPMWQLDQRINARGVQVDTVTLDAALSVLGQAERRYTLKLAEITGGAVGSVNENAKYAAWLAEQGVELPDMQAETVRQALARDDLPTAAREALEIREKLGSANVKKLRSLRLQVSSDGRLRNQYSYCGAAMTGRASAGGVQLQNITAKGPKSCECEACGKIFGAGAASMQLQPPDGGMPGCPACGSFMWHELGDWTIEGVESAIEDVRTGDLDVVEAIWGDAVAVLCGILRGLFLAAEGKKFICSDFSAIEAVAAACLARCQWRIDVFSTHGKIYEQSAANATGIPFEEILAYKKEHGFHHPARKGVGKIRELAGGYGGWINAWNNFGAAAYFDSDEDIKRDVLAWRAESPEIVEMWGGQFVWCGPGKWDYRPELHGLEGAVIQAIQNPGECFAWTDITYAVHEDVLYCRLPSGRFLHYHAPRLAPAEDKLRRGPSWSITFEGYNSNAVKGPVGWHRMETYGGRLFENVVQATAADIQFEAALRVEASGYPVVMHTHDELTAEVPEGFGSHAELSAIMSQRPAWAAWWPIRSAGWEHKRYQKD